MPLLLFTIIPSESNKNWKTTSRWIFVDKKKRKRDRNYFFNVI